MNTSLPMMLNKIEFEDESTAFSPQLLFGGECGDLVRVRYDGATHLGILLGEIAQGISVGIDQEKGALRMRFGLGNPAILIPSLKKVVFGYECWWGQIGSEDDLSDITDEEIENLWYVKALKGVQE